MGDQLHSGPLHRVQEAAQRGPQHLAERYCSRVLLGLRHLAGLLLLLLVV